MKPVKGALVRLDVQEISCDCWNVDDYQGTEIFTLLDDFEKGTVRIACVESVVCFVGEVLYTPVLSVRQLEENVYGFRSKGQHNVGCPNSGEVPFITASILTVLRSA